MDWSVLISLFVLLILGGAGMFFLRGFIAKTRKEFQGHQPALRVTNLSTMNAGDVITLTPELENAGRGAAFDCVLQLSGWDGDFSVKTIHPEGPRHRKHAIPIVLGPEAPIRAKPLSRCYLRLSCRDRWELRYECWYPVIQVQNPNTHLYNIHIDLTRPELAEPNLSFPEMWKLLRRTSLNT
ncbi:MAG: hypothetical protein NDI90_19700 [Nitrospira sp. BO4]|nr:hypothetical protein [Nitrospira sp. BO4]